MKRHFESITLNPYLAGPTNWWSTQNRNWCKTVT